jgi:hypothetical protein
MLITWAGGIAGKAVLTSAVKKASSSVIERWTSYRAQRFFEGFVENIEMELREGVETTDVDEQLRAILSDDGKSEVLFDAYRRVCLSKSKTIGPRIIGLLTGQLVNEGRMATDAEERVFAAAELLADGDFLEFLRCYSAYRRKAQDVKDVTGESMMEGEAIVVKWCEEDDQERWQGGEFDIGPFNWHKALGRWSVGLEQSGLVHSDVRQKVARRFMHGTGQTPTVTTVKTTITFDSACARLEELVLRSVGSDCGAADRNQ